MALINTDKLEYCLASQSLEFSNGDAVFIDEGIDQLFICIFDGAGHGVSGNKIARIGIEFINHNKHLSLVDLMSSLHKKLKGTHGAVAILGRFDIQKRQLNYVAIGNIFLRTFGSHSKQEVTQGGVLGYQIRTPKEKCITIEKGSVVVFHTDGITSRFNETDYPDILWDDSETISRTLLERFGNNNDDASCAVIRVK